jgi:hypothetical protein
MIWIKPHVFLVFVHFAYLCLAWEQCSESLAGGLCPDGNTCCPLNSTGLFVTSHRDWFSVGCIPSDMGKYYGTCCSLDDGGGGCPVGYECRFENAKKDPPHAYYCQASPAAPMADDLTQRLPRYHLCSVDKHLAQLHGLEITSTDGERPGKLAYYSSHGAIDTISSDSTPAIGMVWIVIHGAGCNADDYFCSALAATHSQKEYSKDVLVVAPWFLEDAGHQTGFDESFLVWDAQDSNGIWRYGADSKNHKISSYTALDCLIETIQQQFGPSIDLVIAGHSSGGQMVHRWSFLTHSWSFHNNMKAIVANPSSFLYLTPLRKVNGEWILPSAKNTTCLAYNTWEWGLGDGGDFAVPYRDQALANASAKSALVRQFRRKRMVYLAGSLDVCNNTDATNTSSHGKPCHSHGLETTCMDRLQGSNRLQRSTLHLESLQHVWTKPHAHELVLVDGVGHDHSFMFNSLEGTSAVFGTRGNDQVQME